jgi:hypothetical protein
MKKKFLFGLIALLSVSLLFLGCSTDDDDEVEVEPFSNVTEDYALVSTANGQTLLGNDTNLDITVLKSGWDGTVYITVTSKTGETLPNTNDFNSGGTNLLWGAKCAEAPAGKWADLGLDLSEIFTSEIIAGVLGLRTTNQAFRYYKGATLLSGAPNAPLRNEPNIYIPESDTGMPIKWKLNNVNAFNGDTDFGIILWSSANPKVITIEVAEYETFESDADKVADIAKIVINYSGVNFAP